MFKQSQLSAMVIASNTIMNRKGFCGYFQRLLKSGTWQAGSTFIFAFLGIMLLTGINSGLFAQQVIKGGKRAVAMSQPPGVNNKATAKLINSTGRDMWDMRLISTKGKISSHSINGAAPTNVVPASSEHHVKLGAPIKSYDPANPRASDFTVTLTFSSPNDSIYIVPTDSLGADIMVDKALNPQKYANTPTDTIKKPNPTQVTGNNGGKVTPVFDASNFVSLAYQNSTGQDVCDAWIYDAKNGNAPVKIDSVFVNGKYTPSKKNQSKVRVFFECVKDGDTYIITVKISNGNKATTYTMVPTNKDSAEIVGNVNLEPIKKLGESTGEKTVKIPGGSVASRVAVGITNSLPHDIHDFIIKAYAGKKKVAINKVKVNGQEWPKGPSSSNDNTIVHVDRANNPKIKPGDKGNITVIPADTTVKIDSIQIQPTDTLKNPFLVACFSGGPHSFMMPNENSAIGITGRSGSLVMINESCSPISQLVFTSPDSGIHVSSASSDLPSVFDSISQTITFTPSILPGVNFNVYILLNTLLPYDTLDPYPFTTYEMFSPGSMPFGGWASVTNSSCASASNGSIDFTVEAGLPPYGFLWSDGSTSEDLNNKLSGTYTLTVTSPSGCMIREFEIEAGQPTLEMLPHNSWCNGSNDGSAMALCTGMTEPLNFLWSNGSTSHLISGLMPGTYGVTIFDAAGCILAGTANVPDPIAISVNASVTNLQCYGNKTGAIDITPGNGIGMYSYKWNNGSTMEDRSGLDAKNYTLTVTDGFGCQTTSVITVTQPAVLNVPVTKINILCGGAATGKITANPNGGTSPYQYSWSNGATSKAAKNLFAGTYTVLVTDAHGCTKSKSATLTENPPLMVFVNPIPPSQAVCNVAGGVPPYSFLWNTVPVQTTQFAIGLQPNQSYTVTVTDAVQCSHSVSFTMPGTRLFNESAHEPGFNLSVYPNPATDLVNVEITDAVEGRVNLELCDATGRIVYQTESVISGMKQMQLDVTALNSGIYSLKITAENGNRVARIVIH